MAELFKFGCITPCAAAVGLIACHFTSAFIFDVASCMLIIVVVVLQFLKLSIEAVDEAFMVWLVQCLSDWGLRCVSRLIPLRIKSFHSILGLAVCEG